MRTRKNEKVDPDPTLPYLIFVGLAKSSDNSMGESMRPTVRLKKNKWPSVTGSVATRRY